MSSVRAFMRKLIGAEDPERVKQLEAENTALREQIGRARALAAECRADANALLNRLAGQREGLPPAHLQVRQVGSVWGEKFHTSGRAILDDLAKAFRDAGRPLEQAERILDFGCGVGRVLWNFQTFPHRGEIWGSDIDAESIAWDNANLSHIGKFTCNPSLPPTQFPDDYFDAIYVISVFTHLPEDMQFAWLAELRRILKPGGILAASFHGEHYWKKGDPTVRAEVESRGFAYRTGQRTEGLPDFYMVAYHSEAYIRARWAELFEIVELKPQFIHGVHDLAVLRKR